MAGGGRKIGGCLRWEVCGVNVAAAGAGPGEVEKWEGPLPCSGHRSQADGNDDDKYLKQLKFLVIIGSNGVATPYCVSL